MAIGGGGDSLTQVGAAWDWLCENEDEPLADVQFRVQATLHGAGTAYGERGRGIYLREAQHVCGKEIVACTAFIKPGMHEDAPHSDTLSIDLNVQLTPSAPWVSCAPSLALLHGGKGFEIKLSVGSLPPGAHHAEIVGADGGKAKKLGALFRVPITVIKPHANLLDAGSPPSFAYPDFLPFTPGHIERRFIVPPLGATWATLTLEARGTPRSRELGGPVIFHYSASQILPSTSMRHTETSGRVSLGIPTDASAPPIQWVTSVPVTGGVTLEVTLAQWWASLGDTQVHLHVEFYGLSPSTGGVGPNTGTTAPLLLDGRSLFGELEVLSTLRRMPCQPSGELTKIERAVRPHAAKLLPPIAPLPGAPGLGDTWAAPDRRIVYDYVLAYKFTLKEAATVTVDFPSLSCQLYEAPYDSQLWGLFDAHKRIVHWGDYHANHHNTPAKLTAGDFEVRLQVRARRR